MSLARNSMPTLSAVIALAFALRSAFCIGAEEPATDKTPQELQAAADAGNAEAQFLIGRAYWYGKGIEKDQTKAVEYYSKAAEKNHAEALVGLGAAYGLGQGVERKDEKVAVEFFRKAAELGSAIGQMNLGTMLIAGKGAEKDTKEGLNSIIKAGEQGLVKAQVLLGQLYATGDDGILRDYAQAIEWTRKAAEQDDERALNLYGVMLRDGLGIERDYAAALSYFRRTAEKGYLKGYLNVGSAYFFGQGVEMDKITGMSWWFAGERLGDGACRETAVRLIAGIDPDDVKKARELGKEMAEKNLPKVIKRALK